MGLRLQDGTNRESEETTVGTAREGKTGAHTEEKTGMMATVRMIDLHIMETERAAGATGEATVTEECTATT